eukprot:Amastigsp_a508862_9.p4 type:complete len:217 gc:universal Amastigsp_a508862_9:564-1214(+)
MRTESKTLIQMPVSVMRTRDSGPPSNSVRWMCWKNARLGCAASYGASTVVAASASTVTASTATSARARDRVANAVAATGENTIDDTSPTSAAMIKSVGISVPERPISGTTKVTSTRTTLSSSARGYATARALNVDQPSEPTRSRALTTVAHNSPASTCEGRNPEPKSPHTVTAARAAQSPIVPVATACCASSGLARSVRESMASVATSSAPTAGTP